MARVFLDTNFFIDLVERRKETNLPQFKNYQLFVSPLSFHILAYIYRYKFPNTKFTDLMGLFTIIPLTQTVLEKGSLGPTGDFEDNLQLHSAVEGDCELFLTSDKKLLTMNYFGTTKITNSLLIR
ncbi:type II toxin-antitoxin system VapC family toxin [Candidatus Gottesmanbacteria bacterium]|nr:type II toxin-antitoxin system VapC family toxin [Candidatus Gottesmanbacteria bacterium]